MISQQCKNIVNIKKSFHKCARNLYNTSVRHFLPQNEINGPVRTGGKQSRFVLLLCSPVILCNHAMTSANHSTIRQRSNTQFCPSIIYTGRNPDLNPLFTALLPCCRSASNACFPTHSMSSVGRLEWYIYESTSFHRQHSIMLHKLVHSNNTNINQRKGYMTLLP